jgi:dGTPase
VAEARGQEAVEHRLAGVARALRLNEDLTEAIPLAHDLGHTPFGHAGESVLAELLPEGFHHWEQSLRVVDVLEKDGQGLNLTQEVRMGILAHSKGRGPFLGDDAGEGAAPGMTLEARLVRAADVIAYIAHDTDDAVRGGVIAEVDLPAVVVRVLGSRLSRQIDTMVRDLIAETMAAGGGSLRMSEAVQEAMWVLRDFLYERVYDNMEVHADFIKASKVVCELFGKLVDDDGFYQAQMGLLPPAGERVRRVADYIAGMTDRYALQLYEDTFLPRPWAAL